MKYKFLSRGSMAELHQEILEYLKEGYKFIDGIKIQGDGYGGRTYYVTLVKEDQPLVPDDGPVYDKVQECIDYYKENYVNRYQLPSLLSGNVAVIVDILTGKGDEFFQAIKDLK